MSHSDQFSEENFLPNAYAQAYTPAGLTRPTRGLAIATFIVAVAYAALVVTNNLSAAPAVREVEQAASTGVYDATWGEIYDGTALALIPSLILLWVMCCIWLGLVRRNAEAIAPDFAHKRRFGWVWAGWIVPFVSLWFPYQVVRDNYFSSARYPSSSPRGWALGRWWWASWLSALVSSRLLDSEMTSQFHDLQLDAGVVQAYALVATVLIVGSLILWGLIIRRIVLTQESRTAEGLRT